MKKIAWYRMTLIVFSAVWLLSVLIYWFNLDNKLIYNVVSPMLMKNYNKQKRDVKL